jgi:replicative DNA helicase
MKDRLPPHDENAEKCVIGCCITSPVDCVPQAQAALLSDQYFYDERCKEVWRQINALPMDKVDIIKLGGNGLLPFLSECQNIVPSAANIPAWLEILVEKYLLRRLISVSTNTIAMAYETTNPIELLDTAERDILAIRPQKTDDSSIKELVNQAIDRIEQKCMSDGSITGLSTGLIDLDKLTDGLHKGEMVVVAALPSRGKTALAVNIAVLNALRGIPVAVLSAEMRPVQLVVRSICSEARANFHKICKEDVPKMTVAAGAISKSPLFIEQASGFTIGQVRAIGRRLKQKHDIQLMVIDYQQRLTGTGDNTEQKTASISKGVKDLCMELNIPIILLSQVNEAGQTKHARATTEDTDSLWKLDNEGEWQPQIQPVKLNVEKCRDGSTGTVHLTFFKEITRFENNSQISNEDVP